MRNEDDYMNNFYTTMTHIDQTDLNSEMIYGITAKNIGTGKVIFSDYKISFNMLLVKELSDLCQMKQPTENEFRELIKCYKSKLKSTIQQCKSGDFK